MRAKAIEQRFGPTHQAAQAGEGAFAARSRRAFLSGLISLVAAPAVVQASSLMPISAQLPYIITPKWRLWHLTWVVDDHTGERVGVWHGEDEFTDPPEMSRWEPITRPFRESLSLAGGRP